MVLGFFRLGLSSSPQCPSADPSSLSNHFPFVFLLFSFFSLLASIDFDTVNDKQHSYQGLVG